MLTQCGPRCDVCDSYIFVGDINPFHMEGIKQTLVCHDKCKSIVLDAMEKKDWTLLPEGPLRSAYQEAQEKEPPHA